MRTLAVLALLVPTIAYADSGEHELESVLTPVAPSPGRDKAPLRPAPWCTNIRQHEERWGHALEDRLNRFFRRDSHRAPDALWGAAAYACSGGSSAVAQRASQIIEQLWINDTGLGEADAVASLTAHADIAGFDAEVAKLCDKIAKGDSDMHRVFETVRRDLFGCHGTPLWIRPHEFRELGKYIDRGEAEIDPQIRLAWALSRLHIDLDTTVAISPLPGYAIDQFDIHVADQPVLARMTQPPFDAPVARIILMDSLAKTRMDAAKLEDAVAKSGLTHLLVDVPRAAFARWNNAAATHHEILARSNDIAKKVDDDEEVPDCEAKLRDDAFAVLKPLKHDTIDGLLDAISDEPIAGLLLARVELCMGKTRAAGWYWNLPRAVHVYTGPRIAAWYAVADELGAAKRRMPFTMSALPDLGIPDERRAVFERAAGVSGEIARVTRTGKSARIEFVHHRQKVPDWKCGDGSKIDKIDSDGKVHYRQVCHAEGTTWSDDAPDPVVVPTRWAAGLAVGRWARFSDPDGKSRESLPAEVYANRQQKKLVAIYGFAW